VSGVDKHFDGVHALRDVSLLAPPGQITAVIGPNGSGKTTLLNVILGFYRLDAGQVSLDGKRISGRKPFQIARAGLARTFQTPVVLPEHTCRENVMSGAFTTRRATLAEVLLRAPRARRDWQDAEREADRLLRFVGLGAHIHAAGGSLTAGQRRLLDIARALAPRPSVLLLDEPAAGLVGVEVEALAQVLRRLRDAGHVVVLVEHNINLVMAVADRVTVLDRGQVIASADPATVQQDPAVLDCYLGGPTRV
jgi:branched-chain amino acid transport system permease protein